MSNQNKIQSHNTRLEALEEAINALPDAGTSEDLTAVLDAQEQLISELEAELEGKATSNNMEWIHLGSLPTTYGFDGGESTNTYYTEIPNNVLYLLFNYGDPNSAINPVNISYRSNNEWINAPINNAASVVTVSDLEEGIISLASHSPNVYMLIILA